MLHCYFRLYSRAIGAAKFGWRNPHEFTKPPLQPDGEETAQYIAVLAHELRTMAAKANLGFLAYLLAMVEDEATANARKRADQREGA